MARATDTVVCTANEDFGYSDKAGRKVGAGAMVLREPNGRVWLAVFSTRDGVGYAGVKEQMFENVADATDAIPEFMADKRKAADRDFVSGKLSMVFEPAADPNAWMAADDALIASRRA